MGPESVLTRRTLLSGGALFGLSGLLAACGQQASNEAAATASAVPSETATASASATEASSASATPSPVITRGYSGGSKAPDGEYRKADAYGPAQNVPKLRRGALPRLLVRLTRMALHRMSRSPRIEKNTPKLKKGLST